MQKTGRNESRSGNVRNLKFGAGSAETYHFDGWEVRRTARMQELMLCGYEEVGREVC